MSTVNAEDIKKLNRCLSSGNPILFTGAGFSMGADKGGESIPSGNGLKKMIIKDLLGYDTLGDEYEELSEASLPRICTFATDTISELRLKDFIIERLSGFHAQGFHDTILAFPNWKKVYTVNIDDIVESSRYGDRFVVQNTNRKIEYTKANKIEYIKLHGCVRNRDGRIVFSSNQYIDSMLHSTDYRFSSFAQDMQVDNFVIVGTEMNEINLDYYLELFSVTSGKTVHGQFFFVNPKPSMMFKARVKSLGATVIEWTTEEFAQHISTLNLLSITNQDKVSIKDYLDISEKFKRIKAIVNYKSFLYFGDYPDYKDIVFDWDFSNPDVNNLIDYIRNTKEKGSFRQMLALYGKAMVGKSLYLKRIAVSLLNENYAVYQFCGKEFDIKYFSKCAKRIPESNIALFIDDASFYYREIGALIRMFPLDKNLFVITTARSYSHFRKRYCLVSESWFEEFHVTGETFDTIFASNIAERLDEKGLLGKMKAESKERRIEIVKSFNDVSSFLYSITNGHYYQDRVFKSFSKLSKDFKLEHDFLIQLSIFYKMNLSFLPSEIFHLIYGKDAPTIIANVEHFITFFPDRNGYAIRSPFLVPHILKSVSNKKKVKLLIDVLMYVSPQVDDGYHSYWNEIASTLMKCKLLRRPLGLNNTWVKELLLSIKNYYNDDYNYWLQVGLAEQYDRDFELALNHFQQAESLSPNSYLVKNAIARNFLRQANEIDDQSKAVILFDEGVRRMESLIREREEFQVKAYSTHCLLYERIRFYRKYDIVPNEETLRTMYTELRSVFDKNPDDPMSKHISNCFRRFVEDKNLKNKLPKMNLEDLAIFRESIVGDEMSENDYLENFELDE